MRLLSVAMMEWWTQCIAGVTSTARSARSRRGAMATLLWVNKELELSTISKTTTAVGGAPKNTTSADLYTAESRISPG